MIAKVKPLTLEDIPALTPIAESIFREHYSGMISDAQIDYMIAQTGYHQEHYEKVLKQGFPIIKVAWVEQIIAGYITYSRPKPSGQVFIPRLYIQKEYRGKGIGKQLLGQIDTRPLELRVNRNNSNSIAFYKRYGFEVIDENILEIGGGFAMDDYIMRCEA